jgi:uncharacterized membrane protein (DUF485 family)
MDAQRTGCRRSKVRFDASRERTQTEEEIPLIDPVIARIRAHPEYQTLRRRRNRLGWTLTIVMLFVYYGFIALIAFDKAFLAQPVGAGVTTVGIPMGLGVIVFTVLIVGYYVRRANSEFDSVTARILKESR